MEMELAERPDIINKKHQYLLNQPLIDNTVLWDALLSNLQNTAVMVAFKVGLFTLLGERSYHLNELSQKLSLNYVGAEVLISILCALKLLTRREDNISLTFLAQNYFLPTSMFNWCATYHYSLGKPENKILLENVLKAITASEGQLTHEGNKFSEMWREGNITAEAANMFTPFMHAIILAPAIGAIKTNAFRSVKKLLDVGGGSGGFSVAFTEQGDNYQATIFDLPAVCEVAKKYVERFKANAQVNFYAGNFLKDKWPAGYEGVLFSQIFHNWPLENCKKLAVSAYEALKPGGKIFLHEMLLNENKDGPLTPACFSLIMLISYGTRQFTKTELFNILKEAGFVDIEVTRGFGYFSLVTGKKPS